MAAAAFGAVSGSAGADQPGRIELGAIEVHLFYFQSGRLSPDLLDRAEPFVGWNTVIGEGDAEEPADDLLMLVQVTADGEQLSERPVELTAVDRKGKQLSYRRFNSVLTSRDGKAWLPLWLRDVGCAGDITFRARMRDQQREAKLSLECGE